MCDPGYYRDTVVEQCAPCADLCEPTRGQIENCRVNCPGYEISTTTIISFLTADDRRLFDIFLAFVITLTFTMVVALCVVIGFSCYRVFCRPRKDLLLQHANDRRRSSAGSRKPADDTPCTESTELHELGRETKHSGSPSQPAITQLVDQSETSLQQQPCRNNSTPSFVIRTSLYQCTEDMHNVRDISLVLNNRMRTVYLPQISNGVGAASVGSMTDLKHFDVQPTNCSRQPTDEVDELHLIGLREDYLPAADFGLAARPMSLHYLSTTSDERTKIKIDRILQRFPWVQQIWCDADGYCVAVHDKTWPEARQLITEAMRAEGITEADFKFQMKDPIEPQQHCSFGS